MKEKLFFYKAKIVAVYDGDTCTAQIDLGFGFQFNKQKLRLNGIDAPELRGDSLILGRASRDFLRDMILEKEIFVETFKDSKGKYGRYIANIWLETEDGFVCVNDELVKNSHAVCRTY